MLFHKGQVIHVISTNNFHVSRLVISSCHSVLIRELPLEFVEHPPTWPQDYPAHSTHTESATISAHVTIPNPLVPVDGGTVVLGKPKDFPRFASCV